MYIVRTQYYANFKPSFDVGEMNFELLFPKLGNSGVLCLKMLE